MKKIASILIIFSCLWASPSQADESSEFMDLISVEEIKELAHLVMSVSGSCIDTMLTNQVDATAEVKKILAEMSLGTVAVAAELALTEALKSGYPNVCHVLTNNHLNTFSNANVITEPCIWKDSITGRCLLREKRDYQVIKYHWPKYFIEVSKKGNDPHPSFSAFNSFYTANRKVAAKFAGLIDADGPSQITLAVVGGTKVLNELTGLNFGNPDVNSLIQHQALLPFEKARIRANKDSNQPSYEVNIWPVGISKSVADYLSICGDGNPATDSGGFAWPLSGVPMACPIAMSKDAYPYWDTGMLDYVNPGAVRGILTASNPVSCLSDQGATLALETESKTSSVAAGDSSNQQSLTDEITHMAPSLKALRYCSFPIMGSAEAIYNQVTSAGSSFKGPWCTVWGAVAPRSSTASYNSDYAMVNSALKFKSLAHDLFGSPRGNKERWALAYPWEESPGEALLEGSGIGMVEFMGKFKEHLPETLTKYLGDGVGRSTILAFPGDPRLIDTAFTPGKDAKNLAKELAYIAGVGLTGKLAGKKVEELTSDDKRQLAEYEKLKQQAEGSTGISEIRKEAKQIIDQATDDTAKLKEEDIFETRGFCHAAADRKGIFVGNREHTYTVNYRGFLQNGALQFEPEPSQSQCHRHNIGHCLERGTFGKCKKKRRGQLVFYEKLVKVGTKKVLNPTRWNIQNRCSWETKYTREKEQENVLCQDYLVKVGEEDTRSYEKLIDPQNPQTHYSGDTAKAIGQATEAATWVGAELLRAQLEDLTGKSFLPGKKRVYTIFEEVSCKPSGYTKNIQGIQMYSQCQDAVRFEVKKWVQTKLLRKVCDSILKAPLGEPFKD